MIKEKNQSINQSVTQSINRDLKHIQDNVVCKNVTTVVFVQWTLKQCTKLSVMHMEIFCFVL